jgi:hypothetical protein
MVNNNYEGGIKSTPLSFDSDCKLSRERIVQRSPIRPLNTIPSMSAKLTPGVVNAINSRSLSFDTDFKQSRERIVQKSTIRNPNAFPSTSTKLTPDFDDDRIIQHIQKHRNVFAIPR